MNLKKFGSIRILTFLLSLFSFTAAFGQVTTSVISGNVTDTNGNGLPGATVIAVHTPSGTKYGTVTNATGRYLIPAVRVGGPFTVTVSFVGYNTQAKSGIMTSLGTTANVDVSLTDQSTTVGDVTVIANRSDIFSSERTGASSTIDKQTLQALPTVGSRSIDDFTKYNPQGNGRSFGGQDTRLNNFTIDGSVFNNGFGLGSSAQAGGRTGATAISLDAIEELQVNVAPFDVRQSGFVGAGLNAITRSGTNDFSSSVYYSMRDNSKFFLGNKAKDLPVASGTFEEDITGLRVGGPIIKDKLFFFANGEFMRRVAPATSFVANGSTAAGTASRPTATDLQSVSDLLLSKYGYKTGAYEGYDDPTNSDKFLVRLDYNLSDRSKLTARYTFHNSKDYVTISNSSSAGNGNRIGTASLSYANSGYYIQDNTRSIVAELNTTLGNQYANNFIIGYDKQIEDRAYTDGGIFPTVDILSGSSTYISVGMDPFTPDNKLNYGTFHITDNFTIFSGNHLFTLGTNYEYYKSNNLFYPASNGVWIYNSLQDFINAVNGQSVTAKRFQYRYSALPNGEAPMQVLKAHKFDLYGQDEYQVNKDLKVTLGLRASAIFFGDTALENTTITAMNFKDMDGNAYKVNTGAMPDTKILWEPRLGFNYDVQGDKSLQVRGGSGVFTGRPPYVWISNQIGNNGILTGFIDVSNTTAYPFTNDPSVYTPANPTLPSTFDIAATDPNYKYPQVWKNNFAVDAKLPLGLVGTVEAIYSKFLNSVLYFDANLEPATTTFSGPDNRPRFPGSGLTSSALNNAIRINDSVSRAAIMTNSNEGDNMSFTLKLEKPWTKGFYAMVAYTGSRSRDVMTAGSIASGSWTAVRSVNGNNQLPLTIGDYDIPKRLVGALSYRQNWVADMNTTISLGYVGGNGATRYSWGISGDMNGDGVSGNDLLFVPTHASDLKFTTFTLNGATVSVADQQAAFDAFIDQDAYLSTRRGQYAERNASVLPWLNQFDLSLVHEFGFKVGGKRNALQVRFDMQNVGNFINNDWGVGQQLNTTTPLVYKSVGTDGIPVYTLNTQTVKNADGTTTTTLLKSTYSTRATLSDVWNGQLGIRWIFN